MLERLTEPGTSPVGVGVATEGDRPGLDGAGLTATAIVSEAAGPDRAEEGSADGEAKGSAEAAVATTPPEPDGPAEEPASGRPTAIAAGRTSAQARTSSQKAVARRGRVTGPS